VSVLIVGNCYIDILKYVFFIFLSVTMFGIARSIVMYYCYYYSKIYSRLLVISWRSSGKSRLQEVIKAIYSSTLRMLCAVLINMIF